MLHTFEIVHVQAANFWPKPNCNPNPNPSQILQHISQIAQIHKLHTTEIHTDSLMNPTLELEYNNIS